MEPLDPELQSLVAAERREVERRPADRERVGRSLAARVGVGFGAALGLVSTPAAGAAVAGSSLGVLFKVGLAVVVAGAAALVVAPRLSSQRPQAAAAPAPLTPA